LDHPDAALHFTLGLRRVRATDAWANPQRVDDLLEAGMPVGGARLHVEQHRLHAIGQHRLGQPAKIVEGLEQTADEAGGIGALDEGDKTHPRVTEDGGEAEDLLQAPLPLEEELAPVKLELLPWLRLVANDGVLARRRRRSQRTDEILEDTDLAGIALSLQTT